MEVKLKFDKKPTPIIIINLEFALTIMALLHSWHLSYSYHPLHLSLLPKTLLFWYTVPAPVFERKFKPHQCGIYFIMVYLMACDSPYGQGNKDWNYFEDIWKTLLSVETMNAVAYSFLRISWSFLWGHSKSNLVCFNCL